MPVSGRFPSRPSFYSGSVKGMAADKAGVVSAFMHWFLIVKQTGVQNTYDSRKSVMGPRVLGN